MIENEERSSETLEKYYLKRTLIFIQNTKHTDWNRMSIQFWRDTVPVIKYRIRKSGGEWEQFILNNIRATHSKNSNTVEKKKTDL